MPRILEAPLLLRGNVVQPDGTAADRYVLVRDGVIQSVSRRRPPLTADAVYVETGSNDWIFPGLIDLHTHTSFNLLPLWDAGRRYNNRHEWRGDQKYHDEVGGFLRQLRQAPSSRTKAIFAEFQAIAGGTTLLQEGWDLDKALQTDGPILTRGTGDPTDLGLPPERGILSVVDFFKPEKSQGWRPKEHKKLGQYLDSRDQLLACLAHLAEGRAGTLSEPDEYSRREFEAFIDLAELQDPEKFGAARLALIHCCGVDTSSARHLEFLRQREIGVVWSPVSNFLLYGDTPEVEALVDAGITVSLGSDWSPSGSKSVWDEAKFARFYFDAIGAPVSDAQIYQMVSSNPAAQLGLDTVGRIAPGAFGDFFILRSPIESDFPMEVFLNTDDRDVLAVIVGGRPLYGQRDFLAPFGLDLQPLPRREGTAVEDKAVHFPAELGIDVEADLNAVEDDMKALGRKRSNLLASADKPYRRRIRKLRRYVLEYGGKLREARHTAWKARHRSRTQVPPDAARVWSGFRLEGMTTKRFRETLADTFIPSTASLVPELGLNSYLPAILPDDKPDSVPDEIALVYYESQDVYQAARNTLAGRIYAKLHGIAFAGWPQSWSDFPELLGKSVENEQPYYLFEEAIDWQRGVSRVLVATRKEADDDAAFRKAIYGALDRLRKKRPKGLENVVLSVKEGCLVWWEHWKDAKAARTRASKSLEGSLDVLMSTEASRLLIDLAQTRDSRIAGTLHGGECYNVLFTRRAETT